MFTGIRTLIQDLKTLGRPALSSNEGGPLGGVDSDRRSALFRVIMQCVLTVGILGLCIFVVSREAPNSDAQKFAQTGFGVIIGYWFR